jgi:hypothetical protein
MANQDSRQNEDSSGDDIPIHPLISKMMVNGEPIDSNRIIEGFVGPAEQNENIRIYFDLTFTSYFEIAKVDVLHVESSNANDDNKPTKVWINKSARLEIVTIQRVSIEAAFLQGALTNRLQPFQLPVGLQPLPPNTASGCTQSGCGSSIDICGTSYQTGCYQPTDGGCNTLYGPRCYDPDPCTGGFPRTVGRSPARPCAG